LPSLEIGEQDLLQVLDRFCISSRLVIWTLYARIIDEDINITSLDFDLCNNGGNRGRVSDIALDRNNSSTDVFSSFLELI
jgi:hypothetical protein